MNTPRKERKQPSEIKAVGINYEDWILDGEYITEAKVTASLEDDITNDQTSTVIQNTGSPPDADLVEGTASEAGSETELTDDTTNFAVKGVRLGMKFLNLTQLWVAHVKTIEETAAGWSKLTFEAQPRAVANSDSYKFFLVQATVKAGLDGQNYRITFKVTTSTGRVSEDEIILEVREK